MNDNMMAQLDEADIDDVSGGVLALALVPFVVGFVAGRIYAVQTQ